MRTFRRTFAAILTGLLLCSLIAGCQKANSKKGECWDPNWLIGTWEGTTPSSITPFENTKIKIVIKEFHLGGGDTLEGGTQEIWAYEGTFTWDVDGTPWSVNFTSEEYPQTDSNIIIWDCLTVTQANQTMNNISLRIGDLSQTDPYHSIDLDFGPVINTTGIAPTQIDFYGDVEITVGENYFRSDYPPVSGSMIRMKKK